MATNQTFSWAQILTFLSPAGQQQIVEFIQQAKRERGAAWLEEIQTEFPTLCWIVELVANRTADESYTELQEQFPTWPLFVVKAQLYQLHALLSAEIDRKR